MIEKELKVKMLVLRLEGYSIHKIAEKTNRFAQTVHSYLSRLTQEIEVEKGVPVPPLALTETERSLLAVAIVEGNGDIPKTKELAAESGLDNRVDQALAFIKTRRATNISSEYYPKIQEWRRMNGVSIGDFCKKLGISRSAMTLLLNRRAHLRLSRAKDIKKITGLSLREIYKDDIEEIDAEISKQRETEAKKRAMTSSRMRQNPASIMTTDKLGQKIVLPPPKKRRTQE